MNSLKPTFTVLLLSSILLAPHLAHAQTPLFGGDAVPTPPVPERAVKQAEAQAQGQFTSMRRSIAGGQIQEAWDAADDHAGVMRFQYCPTCSYKVRLREHMVSLITLPKGETIKKIDVGDKAEFIVEQRDANGLSIKPAGYGVDSNVMVFGTSGAVYPIYLRSENFYSVNIPDLFVEIVGTVRPKSIEVAGIDTIDGHVIDGSADPTPKADIPPLETDGKTNAGQHPYDTLPPGWKPPAQDDFVKQIPFDPDKLRGWGEYELWGDGPHIKELKEAIATVFKDDYMTFIRFKKLAGVELPTAYVVVDGIDELVNTRIDGNTYIIESTQRLITFKSGQTYLCIKYTGAS